ncbi:MAG: TfoX/Sxy family protein [Pseudomonadota bacterium]
MNQTSVAVGQLKNIGPTVARRLHEVGIHTKDDLKRVGAVSAYCDIKQLHPEARTPLCYYLYSLEGALRGQHWDSIGEGVKRSLKTEAARLLDNLPQHI